MALTSLLTLAPRTSAARDDFPLPPELVPAVRFWTDVFTRYSRRDVLIHDRVEPGLVYDVVRGVEPGDATVVASRVQRVVDRLILGNVCRGDLFGLTLLSAPPEPGDAVVARIRVQRGMRDVIGEGVLAERRYGHLVRHVLARHGLPLALAAVPLVESSYNTAAISRAGAVGLWQLTATTAGQYLRVDAMVDERRDPSRASEAAARHLHALREALPSWPLALTAYNHGLTGVEHARRTVGSDDLGLLVTRYRGPAFGFSSRSFYAEFLAARHVLRHANSYFPELARDRVFTYRVRRGDTLTLLARRHGVSVRRLLAVNGLRSAALQAGQILIIRL